MRERPIIFSGPMVRAILDGRKTQTRRVIARQHLIPSATNLSPFNGEFSVAGHDFTCPFGQPCDRLYVKETWAQNNNQVSAVSSDRSVVYRADGEARATDEGIELPWRSPLHMPRWASRLTLEVVSVRVERLQDITEDDTDAEVFGGDYPHAVRPDLFPDPDKAGGLSLPECFARVWDSINGRKPGRAWADDPWVWVIEFKRVES